MSNNNPRPTGTSFPMEIHEGVVPSNSVPLPPPTPLIVPSTPPPPAPQNRQ